MNFFIGIDGGGTKTRCVLTDGNLNVLAEIQGGPSNPLNVGVKESALILSDLINKVLKKNKIKKVDSAAIGLAGAGRKKTADQVYRDLSDLIKINGIAVENLKVTTDIEIAVEGAFAGKSGVILIAGTGSIIFGKNKKGNFFRAGGYGKILGDEGSGYSIGKKGLTAVAKEYDGRGRKTLLTEIIGKEFQIQNRDDLISKIYNEKFNVADIAPLLISAAQQGDPVSTKIIDEEIKEVLLHIKAIRKNIKEERMRLCLQGGLLLSKNYYSNELLKRIKKTFKEIVIVKAIYPPETGAVLIAKNILDKLNPR